MERWAGKVAVVTGASAGIGLETAKALVRHGLIVVGLSRRVDKMESEMSSVKGPGKFYAKACDVTDENNVIEVFHWVEKNFQSVQILVNNAGVLKAATFQEVKTEDLKHVIDVNIMGLLNCTRHALKIMRKNDHEAHIININSNSGHRVPKFNNGVSMNVYPATKHAVTAICESFINELHGTKIKVTSISPGVVRTEIFEIGNLSPEFINSLPCLKPEDVANSIVHTISTPPHVLITELTIKPLGQVH
ncbi:farnesol dehydrogenase [Nasonia vitripennis]|uniref:Farnesol dehydrogenase-like n=1 Tax=Nasonia vitripennis TaxID=7425 RepID=A0A7M7G2K7_NASVI|nr:farnesol dehydrogenase [Nasonia vitripennis]